MDYVSLTAAKGTPGSIANWANYGLLPTNDLLTDAQSLIYQTLRVREMRSAPFPLQLIIGTISINLPVDFLDPIAVFDQYQQPLMHRDPRSLFRMRYLPAGGFGDFNFPDFDPLDFATGSAWTQSVPSSYAIFGEQLQFNCAANAAMLYWLIYFKSPPVLSATNKTNFLTQRYPHILRAACLAVAADFRKDQADYDRCSTRLMMLITDAMSKDDLVNRNIEVDADYSGVCGGY